METAPRSDGNGGRAAKRVRRRVAAHRWPHRSARLAIRMARIDLHVQFRSGYETGYATAYAESYQDALNAMHCWTLAKGNDWEEAYDGLCAHVGILEAWRDRPGRPARPPLACHNTPDAVGRRISCGLHAGGATCCS
jgi:hypothetical protein